MRIIRVIIANLVLISLLSSCSISHLTSKNVKIDYQKPENYSDFNKYQKDAIYLSELVKQTYPRLNSKISYTDFTTESNALVADLENINNDFDFQMRINKFLALLEDGHSYIDIDFPKESKFNFILFKEKGKWIIGNIEKSIDSLVIGSKVVSINGKPIKDVETVINKYQWGENSFFRLEMFRRWPSIIPEYWEAIGICTKGGSLKFETKKADKIFNFEVKRKVKADYYNLKIKNAKYPFTKKQNNGFYYKIDKLQNFAYLQMNTSLDYVSVVDGIKQYTNLITKPLALAYLKKHKKDAMNFGETLQQLFNKIQEDSISNLVIDLRNNEGGDERTGKQLIWYLTNRTDIKGFTFYDKNELFKTTNTEPYFNEITKEGSPYLLDKSIKKFNGNVYVLIGVNTFSAGQILATTISDNKLATTVGQPTGNKPTTQTMVTNTKLPHTKIIVHISNSFIERPDKSKNDKIALFPDIEINQKYTDVINGIDKSFEYIMNLIKKE